MKKAVFALFLIVFATHVEAQEDQDVYNFLRLPVSAHVAALGGENITLTDDDATLIFHNPALISNTADKTINLNYMTYMEGATTASASFVKAAHQRATWGVSAQYMDYGSMREATADNTDLGSFSAKDIAIAGSFAYLLSNRLAGGITARFITSTIGSYNSMAVAFDLGVNYVDDSRGWSVSAVVKNLGGQVKAYDDEFERIPIDVQLGVTKRLVGSPLRLSATLTRLNHWDVGALQHLTVGADLLLGDQFYVAAGYNFRRAKEMKIADDEAESNHGAGLGLGAGVMLQRFKLHVGYGKYHVSTSSLLVNVSYSL